MAAVAACAGFFDYATLSPRHAAFRTATTHMLLMGTASILALASLALRGFTPGAAVSGWAAGTAVATALVTVAGGWFGGRLVYEFGVGVHVEGAEYRPE